MAIKNRYEYLSGILEALDVEHTEAEVHNNEVWRSKVLDGMGVEHTYDDINQTDLWRAKVVEGINAMAGGGGSSDFSTAEVTFLFTGLPEGVTPFLYNPYLGINIGTDDNLEIWAIPEYGSRSYGDGICTTILYKGTALMTAGVASVTGSDNNFYVRDYENPVTLSGAIEEDGDDFIITGDCSITVPLVAE